MVVPEGSISNHGSPGKYNNSLYLQATRCLTSLDTQKQIGKHFPDFDSCKYSILLVMLHLLPTLKRQVIKGDPGTVALLSPKELPVASGSWIDASQIWHWRILQAWMS